MPVVPSGAGVAAYEQAVVSTLELLCSSSEQTYEGFLSSFTHLPAGGAANGQLDLASGLNPRQTASGMQNGAKTDMAEGEWLGDKCQDEHVLDKGVTVGGCVTGARPPGGVKFDNYLDVSDFSREEEDLSLNSDQMALPGEVEEGLLCTASVCHHTTLEFHTVALNPDQGQRSTPGSQEAPEEVQPFTLDENFDYDHAVLSQKHPVL
ncbi:intraflagellar transport-associated protein isoform X2 [Brienomyrus brachyistius]|uniref:intraflagellar transport-associated protein isoform X2 n=1 Tax=Brienomyrus brachyistius TaxID=42636 RepID=UPI0020B3CC19|nr:intraflagellar transport-associated protein isoform X2 [Brienomyrus brachyistius]